MAWGWGQLLSLTPGFPGRQQGRGCCSRAGGRAGSLGSAHLGPGFLRAGGSSPAKAQRGHADVRTDRLTEPDLSQAVPGPRPLTFRPPSFLLLPARSEFPSQFPRQSLALAPGQASHPLLTSSSCRPVPSGSPRVILASPSLSSHSPSWLSVEGIVLQGVRRRGAQTQKVGGGSRSRIRTWGFVACVQLRRSRAGAKERGVGRMVGTQEGSSRGGRCGPVCWEVP